MRSAEEKARFVHHIRMAKRVLKNRDALERLFAEAPKVIERGVSREAAQRYSAAMARAGTRVLVLTAREPQRRTVDPLPEEELAAWEK